LRALTRICSWQLLSVERFRVEAPCPTSSDRLYRPTAGPLGVRFAGGIIIDAPEPKRKIAGTIQKIIGKLPIIGRILTGIHREGLIATEFSIAGPLPEPEVKAKPLSTLSVGIIRDFTRQKPKKDTTKKEHATAHEPVEKSHGSTS